MNGPEPLVSSGISDQDGQTWMDSGFVEPLIGRSNSPTASQEARAIGSYSRLPSTNVENYK